MCLLVPGTVDTTTNWAVTMEFTHCDSSTPTAAQLDGACVCGEVSDAAVSGGRVQGAAK
jgi:hypothetical protein